MLQTLCTVKLQGAMLHVTDMIHCKEAGAITCYRYMIQIHVTDTILCKDARRYVTCYRHSTL